MPTASQANKGPIGEDADDKQVATASLVLRPFSIANELDVFVDEQDWGPTLAPTGPSNLANAVMATSEGARGSA